jgi:hypothetical protein
MDEAAGGAERRSMRIMSMLMAAPHIVRLDAVHCVAYWNNAAIVDVAGDLGVDRMRAIGEAYEALRQSWPTGMFVIVIAQPGTPAGTDDARAESARMLKALGDGLMRMFVVIEERGVVAQLQRSIMRGINVVVRNSRMVVTDTVDEAVHAGAKYVVLRETPPDRATVEQ